MKTALLGWANDAGLHHALSVDLVIDQHCCLSAFRARKRGAAATGGECEALPCSGRILIILRIVGHDPRHAWINARAASAMRPFKEYPNHWPAVHHAVISMNESCASARW